MVIPVEEGQTMAMEELLARLVEIHYERNDYDFHRGTFRVRGDVVESSLLIVAKSAPYRILRR